VSIIAGFVFCKGPISFSIRKWPFGNAVGPREMLDIAWNLLCEKAFLRGKKALFSWSSWQEK
jgi:hypothetical protein